jgi:hypothetical protein
VRIDDGRDRHDQIVQVWMAKLGYDRVVGPDFSHTLLG